MADTLQDTLCNESDQDTSIEVLTSEVYTREGVDSQGKVDDNYWKGVSYIVKEIEINFGL